MEKMKAFSGYTAPPSEDVNFQGIFNLIARRKLIILGTALLTTVLTALVVLRSPAQYAAKAELMIEGRPNTGTEREATTPEASEEMLLTKVELIRSRGILERVISQLSLDDNPEFATPDHQLAERIWSKLVTWSAAILPESWVAAALGAAGNEAPAAGQPGGDDQAADSREQDQVFKAFSRRLNVSRQGRTRIVAVEFTSRSADLAAAVVNAIADLYISDQQEARSALMQRNADWLNDRIAVLRVDVENAEHAVEEFRRQAGVMAGDQGVTLVSRQLQELNIQLLDAVGNRGQIEARLRQLRQTEGTASLTAGPLLQSPLLATMRESLAQLETRAAQYSQQLGERNPTVVQLRAEIRNLRGRIDTELRNLVQGVENELRIAREREQYLTDRIRDLNTQSSDLNDVRVQLRALEREADAKRLLLENFLSRYLATSQQLNNTAELNDRVIAYAQPPGSPTSSRRIMMIGAALLGGLTLGFGIALLLDRLDGGFRSGDQIEHETGFKVIGLIPLVTRVRKRRFPTVTTADEPEIFTEALRQLYTSMMLSPAAAAAAGPKIILVTSSCPSEGKTTTSLCLARLAAQMGRNTAFIEADLRHPRIARTFGLPDNAGLHEVLRGQVPLTDVMYCDPESGAHIIAAGKATTKLLELGGPNAMQRLLASVAREHDLVIVDTPPVLVASDTRFLAAHATQILFVVRWGKTKRDMVKLGLKVLQSSSLEDTISVALSMVDPKKHASYKFSDSSYYNKEILGYYSKSG